MRRALSVTLLGAALLAAGCGTSKEMLLAGRLDELPDRQPIPEPPAQTPNQYYDFADKTVFRQIHSWFDLPRHARWLVGEPKQAINVDGFDEVPNSSWFTNRGHRITLEEALRGPDAVTGGPDTSVPWRVRGVKTQGVTPGFRIKDSRGDTYLLKFDPLTNPEMASGAEIISTKLAWAVGYNTPENYLVFFTPEQLSLEGDVTITDELGDERTLTRADVDEILERVPRAPDGTIRAVASRFLSGKPKGPYSYLGTYGGDANDVFRHEHRRELRGLHVFASFINHNDIRRINALDMYDPDGFLKHYLIDFGSTLGSASVHENLPSEGFQYQLDFAEMGKQVATLGFRKLPWQQHELRRHPAIGYFGAEGFDPESWKPNYPNTAFQRRTDLDGFWGAKQVVSLTDEKIRGIVAQARYGDPDVEAYMVDTLIRRRDAIGLYWFRRVNPLDRFEMLERSAEGQRIRFVDLAVEAGYQVQEATTYRFELSHHDGRTFLSDRVVTGGPEILLAAEDLARVEEFVRAENRTARGDRLFHVKIETRRGDSPWSGWVKAHLLYVGEDAGFDVAGIERAD